MSPPNLHMATHSSILAWRIPWTEESGGLQPMGSHRVRQMSSCHMAQPKKESHSFFGKAMGLSSEKDKTRGGGSVESGT